MHERSNEEKKAILDDVITRGVEQFIDPEGAFKKKLEAKINGEYEGDIIIKHGADPTRPDLHIGHAVILRKLRRLQDIGCKVLFLIGDFTTFIGDPTGKDKTRPEISDEEIMVNMKTYIDQVKRVLIVDDPKLFTWTRNSDWFLSPNDITPPEKSKLTLDLKTKEKEYSIPLDPKTYLGRSLFFESSRRQRAVHKGELVVSSVRDLLSALRGVTLQRLIERDMFQKRLDNNQELRMHEMMYPILQGLDSVYITGIYGSCDLEVGGTDQLFNMMVGRDLMKDRGQDPQAVMTITLLPGTDGDAKMSKSQDNYIGITDTPADMFGKVMSIPDRLIPIYFELVALTPLDQVEKITKDVEGDKVNPRDLKLMLAHQIVSLYHGEEKALLAREYFTTAFQKGGIPHDVPEFKAKVGDTLLGTLVASEVVATNSEFRRLVKQGAISNMTTNSKIEDDKLVVEIGSVYKVGKHRFIKIVE